jgi:DtxR family Mn-dependent transcriptional regulator
MSLAYDTTTQEYIKVIYTLEQSHRVARVTDIAERRGVTKSSVSLVLNQLQKKELIDRKQYGHITLTKAGRRLGSELHKRHHAIKLFLQHVLGVSDKNAERDACKIEHDLSDETWKELKRFTTVLEKCPHDVNVSLEYYTRCGLYAKGDLDCKACMEKRNQNL